MFGKTMYKRLAQPITHTPQIEHVLSMLKHPGTTFKHCVGGSSAIGYVVTNQALARDGFPETVFVKIAKQDLPGVPPVKNGAQHVRLESRHISKLHDHPDFQDIYPTPIGYMECSASQLGLTPVPSHFKETDIVIFMMEYGGPSLHSFLSGPCTATPDIFGDLISKLSEKLTTAHASTRRKMEGDEREKFGQTFMDSRFVDRAKELQKIPSLHPFLNQTEFTFKTEDGTLKTVKNAFLEIQKIIEDRSIQEFYPDWVAKDVHRDMNAGNILVKQTEEGDYTLILIDPHGDSQEEHSLVYDWGGKLLFGLKFLHKLLHHEYTFDDSNPSQVEFSLTADDHVDPYVQELLDMLRTAPAFEFYRHEEDNFIKKIEFHPMFQLLCDAIYRKDTQEIKANILTASLALHDFNENYSSTNPTPILKGPPATFSV